MARGAGEQRLRLAALANAKRGERRLERAGLIALRQRSLPEIDRRLCMARIERERTLQMRHRPGGLVCGDERCPEARMGGGEIRLEVCRRGELVCRLGEAPAARQHRAEIVARLARLGSELRRRAAGGLGLVEPAEREEGVAEIEPGAEMIGLELGCSPIARRRVVAPPSRLEDHAEIVMEVGDAAVRRDRLTDEFDRRSALAPLMGEHAEKMQGRGVARLAREHLAIEPLGRAELSRAMLFERRRKRRIGPDISATGPVGARRRTTFFAVHQAAPWRTRHPRPGPRSKVRDTCAGRPQPRPRCASY